MSKQPLIKFILIIVLCVFAFGVNAQQRVKSFQIQQLPQAPRIDGSVDPAEWQFAVKKTDVLQSRPTEFAESTQRTEWYFGYDQKHLYVAAIAYDSEPHRMVARTMRQGGSIRNDDSMHVLVDGFNNKRSGFAFGLNPNSVRDDAIYTNGTRMSRDWEGIWRGEAKKFDGGWSMEMAIPFNTVTFDPGSLAWGINFWRELPRNNEFSAWQSRSGQVNPTTAGEVSGLSNLNQGVGLDVTPSLSSVSTKRYGDLDSSYDLNPSVDISYKLTPSMNALLTVNTDFAGTEVDERQLGVQRFGLFFPERRNFFLTDFDIFQFGGINNSSSSALLGTKSRANAMPFFSRRIGLSPVGDEVGISGGAKLSGRINGVDVGTLIIHQDQYDYVDDDVNFSVDRSNLFVGRMSKGVLSESAIGLIYTNGDPASNKDSATAGLDFTYRNTRLSNRRTLEGQFWVQQTDNEGVSGDNRAFNAALGLTSDQGFNFGAQLHRVEENYDPSLGFANRVGVNMASIDARYEQFVDHAFLQKIGHRFEFQQWQYIDNGELQSQLIDATLIALRSKANDFARIYLRHAKAGLRDGEQPLSALGIELDPGEYSINRAFLFVNVADHRVFNVETRLSTGGFYNGHRDDLDIEFKWLPNKYFSTAFEYRLRRYDLAGIRTATRQIIWRNEISFTAKASLVSITQYDNLSEQVGINARFRYNFSAGKDLWLVLDHNMQRLDGENQFENLETSGIAKLSYTLRY